MEQYQDYQPTQFDPKGLNLPDRQNWLVIPVGRNRDSEPLAESNFNAALEILGGESDTLEIHRFKHWGCGWFEIMIISPAREKEGQEIENRLENYMILDESDFCERENEQATEYWQNMSMRDKIAICAQCDISIFAARKDTIPYESDHNGRLYGYLTTP